MSVQGTFDKAKGYVKEEIGEAMNDPKMAIEGRTERNIGRMENGELPKVTPPGTIKR